jgi:N-acetylmuramoyl-L-alanine amidase/LysM repeat protein
LGLIDGMRFILPALLAAGLLLSASPVGAAAPPFRVVVDAGHGGRDPGALSPLLPLAEKDVALDVALRLGSALQRRGIAVTHTRTDDRDVGLADRAALAVRVGADALVSIHLNAAATGVGSAASGAEGWYGDGERDAELASALLDGAGGALTRFGVPVRGTRAGPSLAVLRTPVPAALIELGYVTSQTDAAALQSSPFRDATADGLAEGVARFAARRTQATPRVMLMGMGSSATADVGLPGMYFVRPGDTLRAIAAHLGVPHQALRFLDSNAPPTGAPLLVGQPLQIGSAPAVPLDGAPRAPAKAIAPAAVGTAAPGGYVVAEGDTLTRIAAAQRVSVQDLAAWNGLSDADRIRVGQRLFVSRTAATHVVAPNETLSHVALLWNTSPEAIRTANGLRDADFVEAGRVLTRPKD